MVTTREPLRSAYPWPTCRPRDWPRVTASGAGRVGRRAGSLLGYGDQPELGLNGYGRCAQAGQENPTIGASSAISTIALAGSRSAQPATESGRQVPSPSPRTETLAR